MAATGPVTRAVRAAVRASFGAAESAPGRDRGAVRLALVYAAALDTERCPECGTPGELVKLGPLLLAALEALCLTPRARSAAMGRGRAPAPGPPAVKSALDQLRERRAERLAAADTPGP